MSAWTVYTELSEVDIKARVRGNLPIRDKENKKKGRESAHSFFKFEN